ncbi:MAG: oligoendopeptidase F, partial [Rhodothermales bacterium]|nr:oligoendopeptidase F [Rhodothermales bacterium]
MPDQTPTGAESIHWNLADLFDSIDSLKSDLDEAAERSERFETSYRGRVAELGDDELREALDLLGGIQDLAGKAYTYAYLNWSTDTSDPERGALLQHVRERYTAISTRLLFFEVEWADVAEDRAVAVIDNDRFSDAGHWLEVLRVSKPHILTEPEEKIMVEKSVTGRSAWNRFFDETLGAMRFEVDGERLTQQQTLSRMHDTDRDVRRAAAAGFSEGLRANSRPLTFIFNTILADKATDDRLRNYPSWITARNLSNEVADADVEALIEAVTSGYDHVARY